VQADLLHLLVLLLDLDDRGSVFLQSIITYHMKALFIADAVRAASPGHFLHLEM
jgi:hypothetical protein